MQVMQIITKSQTTSFSNSPTCSGEEFAFGDKDLNIAVVTVNGRYPARGHLLNKVCKEIAYVLSGHGKVGVDDQVHELKPGDAVLIVPGERFYWEGSDLRMVMPCSPAFYPEQHVEVA
jgi:mannose-6-phosphate isomerase-like protein (cupin superfamily)